MESRGGLVFSLIGGTEYDIAKITVSDDSRILVGCNVAKAMAMINNPEIVADLNTKLWYSGNKTCPKPLPFNEFF